ncbi:MAG: hypothetical protein C0622_12565 [Desulfuromonas sp.]|nr:MAG: hypothetical protein C0622_12565 [Desulfuromonas sp.]
MEGRLHLPGVRDDYRARLEHVVRLAKNALDSVMESREVELLQSVLLQAQAARAEDARYGAGQLSRGSQRAPTLADCEDGWQRVEEIVCTAEEAAVDAARLARRLDTARAREFARRAEVAAQAARQIVTERNRAYTFHADPGFSFGEGWYLAAAALLARIPHMQSTAKAASTLSAALQPEKRSRQTDPYACECFSDRAWHLQHLPPSRDDRCEKSGLASLPIQIKPGAAQELQARRFLLDAGLEGSLRPYRPRPASPKHLTHIIAEAFRNDASSAQTTLRAAFLGDDEPAASLSSWVDGKAGGRPEPKLLLWVRTGDHDTERNTCFDELQQLAELVMNAGLTPVFFGDAVPADLVPTNAVNLTLCWKEPLFQGADMRRAQLQLFEELKCRHGLVGQIGVTTAGMDGPALMGLPTIYLTREPNVRLGKWVGVVPGYQEVVRMPGYFEIVRTVLQQWQQ